MMTLQLHKLFFVQKQDPRLCSTFRHPTMEPFSSRKSHGLEASSLPDWCCERRVAQLDLIVALFWPILTYFDLFRWPRLFHQLKNLFCQVGLTYFHLFRAISFHGKAPQTGHLNTCSHYRLGFEWFPQLCNVLRCCKAYHADIRLHYVIVFKSVSQVLKCVFAVTLQNWLRVNDVMISVATVRRPVNSPRALRELPRNDLLSCSLPPKNLLRRFSRNNLPRQK